MSEEAVELAKKIKALDKRIQQFRANDERILQEGGVKAQGYKPMAPRYEREREKLVSRIRDLEDREGKVYYGGTEDEPLVTNAAGEEKVKLQSRAEQIEEWTSPEAPGPPPKVSGPPPKVASGAMKKGVNYGRTGEINRTGAIQRTGAISIEPELPEPTWEGLGPILGVGVVLLIVGIAGLYVMISGTVPNIPMPF